MGGIRTSGDLVAWMQLIKKMKIAEAKQYVANKLGIETADLINEEVMRQLREEISLQYHDYVGRRPSSPVTFFREP